MTTKIKFVGKHRGAVNYIVGTVRHAFSNRDGMREKEVSDNYAAKIVEKHPDLFEVAKSKAKTGKATPADADAPK